MQMKLSEIAYFTADAPAMSAFYQKLLGVGPVAEGEGRAIFMVGETKIFIHHTYEPEEGDLPPENHMAFEVEDVDAASKEMEAQGLVIEVAPKDYYWGRSAYLRDPDGMLIELNKPSPQE